MNVNAPDNDVREELARIRDSVDVLSRMVRSILTAVNRGHDEAGHLAEVIIEPPARHPSATDTDETHLKEVAVAPPLGRGHREKKQKKILNL